jgi:hypothetical protein
MKYILPAATLIFPLIAFLIAGVIELRSGKRAAEKILSLTSVLLGILVYGLFLAPGFLPGFTVGNWLIFSAAAVASSGAIIPYSRRSSSVLVAIGGLELVFIGIFFAKPIV